MQVTEQPKLSIKHMTHLGLFEGIGGFSLAAKWMGWETVAWCEWNEFGQKVLKHHFPDAEGFGDITKTDFTKYANRINIITGGFPCQPYSHAGLRKGKEDERHLWPEMLRAIREIQPGYVVAENVSGLVDWNDGLVFNEVQTDLEVEGYEVQPFILPACAVNAPHRRDRIWFIAYSESNSWRNAVRNEKQATQAIPSERLDELVDVAYTDSATKQREYIKKQKKGELDRPYSRNEFNGWQNFPTQSPICGGNDGIPRELDSITFPKWRAESIKAYGNAIVPQVAYEIFKVIEELNKL